MIPLRDRVTLGASLLDTHNPGWFDNVDIKKLDIMDPDACILGQLYGGFIEGKHALGLRPLGEATDFCFCCSRDESEAAKGFWASEILARRYRQPATKVEPKTLWQRMKDMLYNSLKTRANRF